MRDSLILQKLSVSLDFMYLVQWNFHNSNTHVEHKFVRVKETFELWSKVDEELLTERDKKTFEVSHSSHSS